MHVLLLAVLLSATSPIGESGGESIRECLPAQTGCGDRQVRERRYSTSVRACLKSCTCANRPNPLPLVPMRCLVKWPSFVVGALHGSVNFSAVISISPR